ncbi:MAG: hypothetical protein JOZ70_00150 [Pseudolabrys sp.]|nr:hypothetical protein [Pseudolabrys sp.]MBV9953634.1 hypothetical protein [Pseudolabrys sp.]
MSALLATPLFWYGLTLKIAMTAGIVVAASLIVERSGPFIGALIAALPTAGGAALIILAFEHPPQFIADSVIGSLIANAACAVYALAYAWLAQSRRLLPALGGALAIWLGLVLVSRLYPWTIVSVVAVNALIYPLTIWAGTHFRSEGARSKVALTARDLAWRAGIVTFVVIAVTLASHSIGSTMSGAFAFFPVAMSSFFIIIHTRLGGKAAASVAAHVQAPLIGLGLGFVAVHFLAVPLGVWWSYLIGLSIGVAWNGLLWAARRARRA